MGGGESAERKWGELLMTDYITNDTDLTSVANAIRVKAEISGSLEFPSEFISAINSITGGMTVTRTQDASGGDVLSITGTATEIEPLSVTANGTYTAPNGKAYSPVTVDVSGGGGTTVNVGFTGASTNPKICYIDANGTYHSEGANVDSSTYTFYWSASVLENSVVIIFYDAAYNGAQYANLYQEELVSLGYRANWQGALVMRAVAQ